jgi:outer membrane cobalamin receptor
MKKIGVLLVCKFLCLFAFGQENQLDTLTITAKQVNSSKLNTLTAKEIQQLQANDAGEVMQKLPGVTVKNYGGIGGMKTVSVRGLGSAYQQIVLDGFLIPNTQTGMIDLGTIYASNIETVQLLSGGFSHKLAPVSAVLGANILWIDRSEATFPIKKHTIQARVAYGSFNSFDSWLSYKFKLAKKHVLAVSGSFRTSEGNYPYRFQNYNQLYKGKRVNADLQEGTANAVYQFRISDKIKLDANYTFYTSDKGLPGAVILYLNAAKQRLNTISNQANLGLSFNYSTWNARFYTTFKRENLTYLDNGYLNIQGFLKSNYIQSQLMVGWVMNQQLGKYIRHEFGIENFMAQLKGDISTDVQPQRIQLKGYYGIGSVFNWGNFKGQLASQTLSDFNERTLISKSKIFIQPSFYFSITQNWAVVGDIQFFYKRNVRVAGFNELYYNQVGNKDLKPETANQFQLSFSKKYTFKRSNLQYGINSYYNQEQNKIVAIPTKNLFVWMIQNVDKVQVLGVDAQIMWTKYWKNWNLSASLNYTFQSVTNRTDKTTTIYGNQIAYFPKNLGNFDISTNWKNLGFGVNLFAVSKRYALNENNKANEVNGYLTADAQISYKLKIKEAHQLTLRVMCKNIGNLNYAYIKYYVMPGINYLIALNYEF